MRSLRVCIYGGTDLDGMQPEFVSALAEAILTSMPAIIVTGGFLRGLEHPEAKSTDASALDGARRVAARRSVDVRTLFEAWVPEGSLDGRPDIGGVVRMTEQGQGITVRVASGRTALGRRLAMVAGVDALITVSGKTHTEVVLEQAIELGVPALPIALTGGDSEKLYEAYEHRINAAFAPGSVAHCFRLLRERGLNDPEAIQSVVDVIRSARVGRCLVLQPYRDADEKLYEKVIRPAVEAHMQAVRLKDASGSQQIYASFFEAVAYSTTIIADITRLNENVMYEVGYAHGRGLQPLLFSLNAARIKRLPIYFKTLNVHALTSEELPTVIADHLRDIKHRQEAAMPLTPHSAFASPAASH
jgi:hypothetical protein